MKRPCAIYKAKDFETAIDYLEGAKQLNQNDANIPRMLESSKNRLINQKNSAARTGREAKTAAAIQARIARLLKGLPSIPAR